MRKLFAIAFLLCTLPSFASVQMQNCNGATGTSTATSTCTGLSTTAGHQLIAFQVSGSAAVNTFGTPTGNETFSTCYPPVSTGTSNQAGFWCATAASTGTDTITLTATCSGTCRIGGVVIDTNQGSSPALDTGLETINTNVATSAAWSINTNLTAGHANETIWICGGTSSAAPGTFVAQSPFAGMVSHSASTVAAGCEVYITSSGWSYTSGTELIGVGTSQIYAIGTIAVYANTGSSASQAGAFLVGP
jgi:hypothetical protein